MRAALLFNEPDLIADLEPGMSSEYIYNHIDAVEHSLGKIGCEVLKIDINNDIQGMVANIHKSRADVIFNLCESVFGRPEFEMNVVTLLELLKIPYTGTPPLALGLCLNKYNYRFFLKDMGIKCPRAAEIKNPSHFDSVVKLRYPVIVKPLSEDGSTGISEQNIFESPREAKDKLGALLGIYSDGLIAEEYIDGREFNCFLINTRGGTKIFPVSEIEFRYPDNRKYKIISYDAKWNLDSVEYKSTVHICPADITNAQNRKIFKACSGIFDTIIKKGYARVDFRMDARNNIYVIDVNPNPDISPDAGAIKQIKAAGWTYANFVEAMIEDALEYMKNPIFLFGTEHRKKTPKRGKDYRFAASAAG
ncbi:MAG: ATP-grasp domain-containing protein [bacterium]|nr:ATP-grasp domain-containing protein [bacterium]